MKGSIFDKMGYAIGMHGRALGFMINNGLLWYFLVPLVLIIGLIYGGMSSISYFTDLIIESFEDYITFEGFFSFLNVFITGFLSFFLRILMYLTLSYFGGYIVIIIMSPFLAYVSEKTEEIETGKEYPFDLVQLLKDAFRGILLAIRNLLLEFAIMLLVYLLSFIIPVIGPLIGGLAGSIYLFLLSSYFYGFSFMDYALERKKLSVGQSVTYVRKRKGIAIGTGLIFSLLLFLPFGAFITCFFAILSTVSATLMVLSEDNREALESKN